jgi:hypothetical protein
MGEIFPVNEFIRWREFRIAGTLIPLPPAAKID